MFKTKNTDFILTPVSSILKDGLSVINSLNESMSLYPIGEYLLSSIFIKMSGAQEQKLKCICWDMATENPEYRVEYLRDIPTLGEFSTYKAKNKVYCSLIKQITSIDDMFCIKSIDFQKILNETKEDVCSFSDCLLFDCFKASYSSFDSNYEELFNSSLIGFEESSNSKITAFLFKEKLQDIYEKFVYRKRNQIAHNTLSYQYNVQKMKHMCQDEFVHDNYFTRFAVLILIDKIFISLFEKYLERIIELEFDG